MRTFLLACGVAALAVIHVQTQGGGWFGVLPPFDARRSASPRRRSANGHRAGGAGAGRGRTLYRSHGCAHPARSRDNRRLLEAEPRRRRSGVGTGDRIPGRRWRRTRGPPSSCAPPACRTCRCSATRPARRCGGRRTGRCASSPPRPMARAAATSSSRAPCRRADRKSPVDRSARRSCTSGRSPTPRCPTSTCAARSRSSTSSPSRAPIQNARAPLNAPAS